MSTEIFQKGCIFYVNVLQYVYDSNWKGPVSCYETIFSFNGGHYNGGHYNGGHLAFGMHVDSLSIAKTEHEYRIESFAGNRLESPAGNRFDQRRNDLAP